MSDRPGPGKGRIAPGAEALSIGELSGWAPRLPALLEELGIQAAGNEGTSLAYACEEAGVLAADVLALLAAPAAASGPQALPVRSLRVVGGRDKQGRPEPVAALELREGEVVAVVGPTGSGKSLLLGDVDSLAQGDSPSGRRILLDGRPPPEEAQWSAAVRPVAWIAQGMGFLLDLDVREFVALHASTRGCGEEPELAARVLDAGCTLCGEPFALGTPLASLSGGQARALMIADAVLVSRAPIVLVDEIENAGIDRERALRLLTGGGKLVLAATHDPLLALRADRRVVLANGAMQCVLDRSDEEREELARLAGWERELAGLRDALRAVERVGFGPAQQ